MKISLIMRLPNPCFILLLLAFTVQAQDVTSQPCVGIDPGNVTSHLDSGNGDDCVGMSATVRFLETIKYHSRLERLFPECTSAAFDTDGDGYGWENEESCLVAIGDLEERALRSIPDSLINESMLLSPVLQGSHLQESLSEEALLPQDTLLQERGTREKVNVCEVTSLASLQSCLSNASTIGGLDIKTDLVCTGGQCCTQNSALMSLNGISNFTIHGNNHLITRESGQKQCSLLDIRNANDIVVENWFLDDSIKTPGCLVAERCPRMVHILNSSDITLDNVHVSNGKAYNVYVDGVEKFSFLNSSIANAGILGLYVGHGDNYSSDVAITDSVFTDIQTNAIALLGVAGNKTNVIRNNSFFRNHRHGHWEVAEKYGIGTTGGGQLYIARADNVLVESNIILDGYCDNCFISGSNRTGIHGLELGEPNRVSISNIAIKDNTIGNNDGVGIYLNQGNIIDSSIEISGNTLFNNTESVQQKLTNDGATVGLNDERSTRHFESFESSAVPGNDFQISHQCAPNSTVGRICNGESLHGSCAVHLTLGTGICENAAVSLESKWYQLLAGQKTAVSGWLIRNSDGGDNERNGDWCVEFANADSVLVRAVCRAITSVDETQQGYVGLPLIDLIPPAGSTQARWIVRNKSSVVPLIIDDIKITGVR